MARTRNAQRKGDAAADDADDPEDLVITTPSRSGKGRAVVLAPRGFNDQCATCFRQLVQMADVDKICCRDVGSRSAKCAYCAKNKRVAAECKQRVGDVVDAADIGEARALFDLAITYRKARRAVKIAKAAHTTPAALAKLSETATTSQEAFVSAAGTLSAKMNKRQAVPSQDVLGEILGVQKAMGVCLLGLMPVILSTSEEARTYVDAGFRQAFDALAELTGQDKADWGEWEEDDVFGPGGDSPSAPPRNEDAAKEQDDYDQEEGEVASGEAA